LKEGANASGKRKRRIQGLGHLVGGYLGYDFEISWKNRHELGFNIEVGSREKVPLAPVVFEAAEIERAVLPTSPLWILSRE